VKREQIQETREADEFWGVPRGSSKEGRGNTVDAIMRRGLQSHARGSERCFKEG
jgi:hypothetical protein